MRDYQIPEAPSRDAMGTAHHNYVGAYVHTVSRNPPALARLPAAWTTLDFRAAVVGVQDAHRDVEMRDTAELWDEIVRIWGDQL